LQDQKGFCGLQSFIDKLRARSTDSLTSSARKLRIEDLSGAHPDFFAVQTRSLVSKRAIAVAAFAMLAGSAGLGLLLSGVINSHNTEIAVTADSLIAPPANAAAVSSQDASELQTASIASVSTKKGDFNGEIAKAIAASPMQTLSVAYINGGIANLQAGAIQDNGSYPDPSADALAYTQPTVVEASIQLASLGGASQSTIVQKTLPAEPIDEVVVLRAGDTLIQRLVDLGVTLASARAVASAIEPVFPGRLVRVGQTYTVTLDREQDFYGAEVIAPVRISFTPPGGEEVVVESDDDGRYIAMIDGKQAKPESRFADAPHYRTKAKVTSSIYATAKDNGVPTHIINAAMKVFSHSIDLQRQIHAGDTFELFYGNPLTGSSTKRKILHYATLTSGGREYTYYRFTDSEGNTGFYDENGVSANKALMRTPISGVRITSGFGMRRHPLLGYNKLHTGIDFGAPRGTPIKAAGDGVVEHAGWKGAYGRTVIIRHNKSYSTLYAHMSKTSGLKSGQRVRQGQVIGYVGSTGRSTGPHLHYEVRKNNRPINPKRVQLATETRLTGKALAQFKQHKRQVMAMMKTAPSSIQIAQAGGTAN
jgi:murein DD-endopeptidase MepM/ murein hydrolase activator NlpD